VTTARCPACDAAVASDAPWCTLCFTDLRPAPVVQAPVVPALAAAAPVMAAALLPAMVPAQPGRHAAAPAPHAAAPAPHAAAPAPHAAAPAALAPHPILDAPVATAADIKLAAPGWPCQACGEMVALDLTDCPNCGGGFLGGTVVDVSLRLPVVGDVAKMSPGGRAGVMAAGAGVIALVLVLLYLMIGHFL
jgi:hypothetical protein